MTATATRTHPRYLHADTWQMIRRAYDGGRGGSIREIAERYGVSKNTIAARATNEQWRLTDNPPRPASRAEIRRRAVELLRDAVIGDRRSLDAAYTALRSEFGCHPGIPARDKLRRLMRGLPRVRPPHGERERPIPTADVGGITRRCYAPGCGQLTAADPCQWCQTPMEVTR